MKAGKNVWINQDGERIKSETRPRMEKYGGGWFPCYPVSRIRGNSYIPYQGISEWEQTANEAMKLAANDNYRRK